MPESKLPDLQGSLVKLVVPSPDQDCLLLSDWTRDSGYFRFAMDEPARYRYPETQKKWLEESAQNGYPFMIVTQAENRTIGELEIGAINSISGNAWLGIGIGERDFWGKKFGSEAVDLAMVFAFSILNLHRLSLKVNSYNNRAFKAYENLGFKVEGIERKSILRDGRRWDMIYMGIMKADWLSISLPFLEGDQDQASLNE
jgi:RimJ/RimL family protein N-acetyltransferase